MRPRGYWGLPAFASLSMAGSERHDTPCGHAIKKLCERAYQVFGQSDYETLVGISVSHLYNLRQSKAYQR